MKALLITIFLLYCALTNAQEKTNRQFADSLIHERYRALKGWSLSDTAQYTVWIGDAGWDCRNREDVLNVLKYHDWFGTIQIEKTPRLTDVEISQIIGGELFWQSERRKDKK